MITFHLDGSSGVPTYLQLVQQVKQAIGRGILQPGDQLPTVKSVVADLAINPNTVLKAYRELDLGGFAEGRRGQGTFVSRTLPAITPDDSTRPPRVARALDRARAQQRARRRRHAHALRRRDQRRIELEGGMSETTALSAAGLGKRYGASWALRDCSLEIPTGTVTALVGPNGAGKTTLLQLAIGLRAPTAGSVRVFGLSPSDDASSVLPRIGFLAQDHPLYTRLTIAETLKLGRKLNTRWDDDFAIAAYRVRRALARAEGRQALGRAAGAGRAHARARQAARAPAARRAGGRARSARPARVPADRDGGGRAGRRDRHPLLAHRRRPRARLRPPRDPLPGARAARRTDRRDRRRSPAPDGAALRSRRPWNASTT